MPMHTSRRSPRSFALAALVATASLWAPCTGAPPDPGGDEGSLEALALLHQGRFAEAAEAFRQITLRRPGDPEGPLFEALTAWWRLLDVPDDPELRPVLEEKLGEAMRRGEALLAGNEAQRGRVFTGTACLLAAQARVVDHSYVSAGRAARRGHELLEEALRIDPAAHDAKFALGAYNYYADRLSWIVKLVRFFVRIPGGNAKEGIRALQEAGEGSRFFRAESLLLLAYIHSGDDDNDMPLALEYLEKAERIDERPSPLLLAIRARFLFPMGRLGEAERTARRAVEVSEQLEGVAPAIPTLARLRIALALYYQYRPREAMEQLRALEPFRRDLPDDAVARMEGLVERLRIDHAQVTDAARGPASVQKNADGDERVRLATAAPVPAGPDAERALRDLASGRPDEAVSRLTALVERSPGDDVARYHLARALQLAGDRDRARLQLERLLSGDRKLQRTLRGWAMLRMGAALEEAGDPGRASGWYRRAESLKGFLFRQAARDRLTHPGAAFFPEG